jgi:hypothetical protein
MSFLPLELDKALRRAEEYWRRHTKSKAVKAAEVRVLDRKSRAFGRKFRRATALGGVSGAGVVGYGILAAPAGPGLIAAGAVAFGVMVVALSWPARRATDGRLSRAELEALPGEAEEWLLARRASLPVDCFGSLDAIFVHLGDLQACIGEVNPASTLAWEARRLLGSHLPQLVHAYCELPAGIRDSDPEHERRLVEGLETLVEALARLSKDVNRDRLMRFETQGRFLQSRYRDPDVSDQPSS